MDQYKQLIDDAKAYIETRYELLRLELLDKLSMILGMLVLVIVALFLVLAAFAYFSVALVGWMAHVMPVSVACCILAGVLLLILLVLYLLRERLFVNPFIRLLSGIIYRSPEEEMRGEEKESTTIVTKPSNHETGE